jgi:thiol-disulfide isomerase/thioredoxin
MRNFKNIIAVFGLAAVFALSASAQTVLTGLTGSKVDVEAQNGKVVVLAIGASWLPLSEKQVEITNALAKKYAGRDVVIYFVATDSMNQRSRNFASNDDLQKFATANKLGVSVLRDPDGGATLKKFKIDQVPSFVILDKNGYMVGEPISGIDPKSDMTVPLSRAIDRSL